MSMNRTVAHVRIARELRDAEAALNEALLRQSSLLSTLVTARRDVGAAPFMGQDVLLRLVRSQQSLLSAGGDLARVHSRLIDIDSKYDAAPQQRIEKCPPPAGIQSDDGESGAVVQARVA